MKQRRQKEGGQKGRGVDKRCFNHEFYKVVPRFPAFTFGRVAADIIEFRENNLFLFEKTIFKCRTFFISALFRIYFYANNEVYRIYFTLSSKIYIFKCNYYDIMYDDGNINHGKVNIEMR